MKLWNATREKGFSLVELMVVVGIIGILATLAMPRFKQFQAKAKMSEAKTMLSHIYSLEQAYYLDQNQFTFLGAAAGAFGAGVGATTGCTNPAAGTSAIGFSIEPCNTASPTPRYSYEVYLGNNNTAFLAAAKTGATNFNRVCPGNAVHFFAINDQNTVWSATTPIPTAYAAAPATAKEAGVGTLCPN